MRIAFNLDDTLIPSRNGLFPVERPRGLLGRLLARERLRRGAPELIRALARQRCDVWVYTTSARSTRHIKDLFHCYGVRLGGAINMDMHFEWLKQQPPVRRCSKYPPAFVHRSAGRRFGRGVDGGPAVRLPGRSSPTR